MAEIADFQSTRHGETISDGQSAIDNRQSAIVNRQ